MNVEEIRFYSWQQRAASVHKKLKKRFWSYIKIDLTSVKSERVYWPGHLVQPAQPMG